MHRASAAALALALSSALYAQSPAADWRTVATAHFRVHYPAEYEAWSRRTASRLESIRDAVSKEVGYAPEQIVDVIVMNPVADPNGLAYPLLDSPRIVFYTEPPGPEEQLGAYSDWIDLLAVHEFAHTAHMLRPSRNVWTRALERFVLPLDPITLHAPRWVLEGYATVIEGRLTGAGRPNSAVRAIVIRKWAQNGRLPTYSQLSSDQRFLGMSMAYLAGSAYLEWLEARSGPESLRNLWKRMTARHRRGFNEAFQGVFGDSPERLYGRFVAEQTEAALAFERASDLREGELWQETTRNSGDPAVSPDGTRIAVVLRPRNKPARLVIWSTAPAEKEEKQYRERIADILKRDPEDVAPVRAKPLPREPLHSLTPVDGGDIATPRWTRDGKSIVYAHRQSDREGFFHYDLFRWTPETDAVERITHLADVRDADPYPDGTSAIAVRNRYGFSQLVRVSFDGTITPITEPSLDTIYANPRVSPDGQHIAYIANRELRVGPAILPAHDVTSFNWLSDTELVATISTRPFAELHRITLDGTTTPLTRSTGGAFDPAPSPDGRIFFMAIEPDGYVVRALETLLPATRGEGARRADEGQKFEEQQLPPSTNYGLGRQEFAWFLGTTHAANQHTTELGVRFGDVVGRFDTLLIGSDDGAALVSAWRGWPVELFAHAFKTDDNDGLELRGTWTHRSTLHQFEAQAGALTANTTLGFAETTLRMRQLKGTWRVDEALHASAEFGDASHQRIVARGAISAGAFRVSARYQHDHGDAITLGGLPSSLVPRSSFASTVVDPALPVATLRGDRYDGARIELELPGIPVTAFYQQHRLSSRLTLAGIELAFRSDPVPIVKLPGLDFTAGAARVFDDPLRDRTKWWLGVRWTP